MKRPSNSPRWDDLYHRPETEQERAERMRLAYEANAKLRDAINEAARLQGECRIAGWHQHIHEWKGPHLLCAALAATPETER